MKDVQGLEFKLQDKVAYVYQAYSSSAIKMRTGYVSRVTEKTLFVVALRENLGNKQFERSVKPSRAVVLFS